MIGGSALSHGIWWFSRGLGVSPLRGGPLSRYLLAKYMRGDLLQATCSYRRCIFEEIRIYRGMWMIKLVRS